MSAEHDQFVLEIGAGNLGDGVIGHQVIIMELDREIDGHFDFLALFAHPDQSVVLFHRQDDLGRDLGCIFIVR